MHSLSFTHQMHFLSTSLLLSIQPTPAAHHTAEPDQVTPKPVQVPQVNQDPDQPAPVVTTVKLVKDDAGEDARPATSQSGEIRKQVGPILDDMVEQVSVMVNQDQEVDKPVQPMVNQDEAVATPSEKSVRGNSIQKSGL